MLEQEDWGIIQSLIDRADVGDLERIIDLSIKKWKGKCKLARELTNLLKSYLTELEQGT